MTSRLVALATSISIVTAGTPTVARAGAGAPPISSVLITGQSSIFAGSAETTTKLLEAIAKEIPRDTFDPDTIISAVGKDRSDLLAWVRDQTYWVPYRGALRGPTGVLMDRLGNSLDRSLLLAELLTRAGHTVRLAQGDLSDQSAGEVALRLRPVPPNPVPAAAADYSSVTRTATQSGLNLQAARENLRSEQRATEAMKTDLDGRVAAQAPFLANQLGARAEASDASAATVAALKEHWWVQVQDAGQWVDLDPMWPAARAVAGTISAARTIAFVRQGGAIPLPPDLVHEVTLRVVVEQWKQGKVVEKTPVEYTFRPAETYGQPIGVQVVPSGWPRTADLLKEADPPAALKAILEKQKEWLPSIIVGDRVIRQSSFADTGELNTKPGQPMAAAAAVASSINDVFGGGDPDPEGQLSAVWIEYETRVPGREPQNVRRDLFDWFDQKPRSSGAMPDPAPDESKRITRALSLATAVQILPIASRPSREFITSQLVADALANGPARLDIARRAAAGDVAGAISRAESLKLTVSGQLLNLAYSRFEWSAAKQEIYLDAPNLLSYRTSLVEDASRLAARQGFDLVANSVAIRPGASGNAIDIRVKQGTVDTNLEDLLMGRPTTGNAGALLGASKPQGWVTVRDVNDQAWSDIGLPAEVRARIEDQLRLGYVVVAPGETVVAAAKGQTAWWRIDPKTGETLGFGSQGWGQGLAEYAVVFAFAGLLTFAVCMAIKVGPRQTSAQLNRNLGQCACYGSGAALAITAPAALGEGLFLGLFIAGQFGFLCTAAYSGTQGASGSTGSAPMDRPLTTCGPLSAVDWAPRAPVPPW